MEDFRTIGYYICEVVDTPEWLHGIGRHLLSVSGCFGEQHPKWECFMGGWGKGEGQEYQKRLRMNDKQYSEFLEVASHLFSRRRMDIDCRFRQLSDAQDFYKKFCRAIPCRVVSISTVPEYFQILEQELEGNNSYGLMNGEMDSGAWIGNDILGWDISGFHSFLCNSLQNDLQLARFNDLDCWKMIFVRWLTLPARFRGRENRLNGFHAGLERMSEMHCGFIFLEKIKNGKDKSAHMGEAYFEIIGTGQNERF